MAKASARELLRRSREQKKQQQQKGNAGSVEQNSLAEIVRQDSFAKAGANGTLHCSLCDTLVKPTSAVGWSVHAKSRRHVQQITDNSANATQNPTKRSHDEVAVGADVSDNLALRLTINQDTKIENMSLDKDQVEDEIETKRQKVGDLVMYGSDEDSEDEKDEQLEDITTDGGLPQGFFDEGIEQTTDDADEAGEVAESPKLPDGFFDISKEPTTKPQIPLNKMQLTDSLAAFENDIADLAETIEPIDIDKSKSEPEELVDDLETQATKWVSRTRHLAKLHSIIEEGAREMDADEDSAESMREVASDMSSGDEDYAEFTSWRLGQL
ncbi:hypothetical protein GGH12_000239 [Coemansia sp. RSA 1822]|nr:hypothetical protein GGH12_000239 [Coemansia sp. RSA 1822]